MRKKGLVSVLFLLLVGALFAVPAFAQEQSGSIEGVVKDSSGGVLPGVTVEARSAQSSGVSTAVTDEKGMYRFHALPPGTYEVSANLSGFGPAKVPGVTIALGQLLKVDLTLSVASLQENVQVTAEAPLIDTKQNAAFATIQKDVIERVPKGRDFTSVITMAPGAQKEAKAGGEASVDGASGSENRFVIDGMDTTNLLNGTSGKTMLVDFIQEVQVKSSGYNAEFGGATGGVVSAITKSGTNQIRGGAGIYFQNDKFYGAKRTVNAYSPWNSNIAERDLVRYRTPWTYVSPVIDFGGPVLKDRLWYYAGFAYTSNAYTEDATFIGDPSLTKRTFDRSEKSYYPNYNITAQVSNNLRVRVSGSNQRNHNRGALPTMDPITRVYRGTDARLIGKTMDGYTRSTFDKLADGSINQAAFDRRWKNSGNDSSNDVLSGNVDWVITPKFFINATGGIYKTNDYTPANSRGDAIVHVFQTPNYDANMTGGDIKFPTIPAQYQNYSGYSDNVSSYGQVRNKYDRLFGNVNAIFYKSAAGQHVIKTGVRLERFGNDIYNGNAKSRVNYYWGQTFTGLDGSVKYGKYGYYMVNKTGTIGAVHSNNISLWLQDSWTVNNKLTINAGVRTENEQVPSYKKAADAVSIKFGFKDKIAPRLGFAYDVKGDSQWKLYGSFGYFYDITKLSLPRGAFGGDHWINYYWSLDTYDWASINCDEGNTGCPGTFYEQWDARRSSNQPDPDLSAYFHRGTYENPGMTGVDPNLKPVKTGEFVLGGDHELSSTMSVGVRYVHKWLFRTIEDVGLNLPNIGEIYIIGNPGFGYTETMNPTWSQYKTPKATRKYDAVELRLRKRFADRWSAEVDYTYSRLYGNYGGLASSDEPNADGNGRTDTNINRYFDGIYMSYDDAQHQVFGRLATDRPHVVKMQATYDLPWGTTVGAYGIVESGTPATTEFSWQGYPVYVNGRGDMGRYPMFKQVDLNLAHEFRLGGNKRVMLQANIVNLFDLKTGLQYFSTQKYRDTVYPDDATFFSAPWNMEQIVADAKANGSTIRPQQLYKAMDVFQAPREIRLQAKFSF